MSCIDTAPSKRAAILPGSCAGYPTTHGGGCCVVGGIFSSRACGEEVEKAGVGQAGVEGEGGKAEEDVSLEENIRRAVLGGVKLREWGVRGPGEGSVAQHSGDGGQKEEGRGREEKGGGGG